MSAFRIENVVIPPGSERALITFEGGQTLGLLLSGGCCSHSFFDHDSAIDLKSIMGQTLVRLDLVGCSRAPFDGEEQKQGPEDKLFESRVSYAGTEFNNTHELRVDVEQLYCLKVTTDKQVFNVFWRNSSNGYYSGELYLSVDGGEEMELHEDCFVTFDVDETPFKLERIGTSIYSPFKVVSGAQ